MFVWMPLRVLSENDIVKKSGFLDKLDAGDLILADRGFTFREMLYEKQDLNNPLFLQGGSRLTEAEEIITKQIAGVRIHVKWIKKFRLLKRVIYLSLQLVFSQRVFVGGCLINS